MTNRRETETPLSQRFAACVEHRYLGTQDSMLVVLLCGGDKSSQEGDKADIRAAHKMLIHLDWE